MMFEYLPSKNFKAVYVVDLCHSLCEVGVLALRQCGLKSCRAHDGRQHQFAVSALPL